MAAWMSQSRTNKTMTASNTRRTALLVLLLVTAACADPSLGYERRSLTRTGSNINETYEQNSEGHTFRTALYGCLAAVGTLAGLMFLVDKDLFNSTCPCTNKCASIKCASIKCASIKCAPIKCNLSFLKRRKGDVENDLTEEDQYVNYEFTKKTIGINQTNPDEPQQRKSWLNFTCEKPQISQDEEEINTDYITAETKQYLKEQQQSKSWSRKLMPFLFKTKQYDENDKYKERFPNPTELDEMSEDEETIVSVLSHQMEEVRLRLFWKPTKDYDENDKYAVTVKDSDVEEPVPDMSSPYAHAKAVPMCPWEVEEIKPKTSSYESSDSTVVPYK